MNCRYVQIYIFDLICELERTLIEFTKQRFSEEMIIDFLSEKAQDNEGIGKILKGYNELKGTDLENSITESLYLSQFLEIFKKFELYASLGYDKKSWKELSGVNDLRNLVAHPTRSLVDLNNPVDKLLSRLERVEDLLFRFRHHKAS